MLSRTVLISIHPEHVAKILSGEKRLEFRRLWASQPVNKLLIYCTAPTKQLVAVATIERTIVGSPSALWSSSRKLGGGITRDQLFKYFAGKKRGFALQLSDVEILKNGFTPSVIFGGAFRAPQSFRYLKQCEEVKLKKLIRT